MNTTELGLEPLIGVEELAEYLGVPVQTIYDWRLSGRAPRAFKLGKRLRFAASDIAAWLEERHESGSLSRPRIPIGGYGEIAFIPSAKGKVEARTRFRDWDGQTRLVQATGASRPAAEVELKRRLAERNAFQPVDTTLTPDSPFPALVDYWLADLDLENRITPATRFNYERDMSRLVNPPSVATRCARSGWLAAMRCSSSWAGVVLLGEAGADRAATVVRTGREA